MQSLSILATQLLTVATLLAVPMFSDVLFTDSTFPAGNYSGSTYLSDPSNTITFDQCTLCGNPGDALQVLIGDVAGGEVAQGLLNSTWLYDPSTQGAIVSINASVDKDATFSIPFGGTSTFRPAIEQDGNIYLATVPGPDFPTGLTTGYISISQTGLTASDFVQFDFSTASFGSANPNFDGDPMELGIVQISNFPENGISEEIDFDNLTLDVVNTPEPSYTLVLSAALFGLVVLARRRKSRPV